jgi:ribosomal protein S18 acetylase RimI-like enzyme
MRAVRAETMDIPGWLTLAVEVEGLFESRMSVDPAFVKILERNVDRGTALVVRDEAGGPGAAVIGAAIWSPERRQIAWLAVAERHRRTGVGSCLLRAIFEVAGLGPLSVVTFESGAPGGRPARLFYEAAGFRRVGRAMDETASSARDLFVRPPTEH